jgi:hypothetical protein
MSGFIIVLVAWLTKDELKEWVSSAIAEGIRRSNKES